eukprot:TRINITY_DN11557_c0_g1_i1.p1 TRINITY_DN11557_c0_g1~~TRINITY_DN11557_c0_g1_i1.p1  ORF type:complete len:1136 (-),score=123.37 TRINITY_DN11557_c0_g1_i1:422-3829(-)
MWRRGFARIIVFELCIAHIVNGDRPHLRSHILDDLFHNEGDREFKERSQLRAALASLASQADEFLAQDHMQAEVANVAYWPLARGLIERGLSLKERFRTYTINYVLRNENALRHVSQLKNVEAFQLSGLMEHGSSEATQRVSYEPRSREDYTSIGRKKSAAGANAVAQGANSFTTLDDETTGDGTDGAPEGEVAGAEGASQANDGGAEGAPADEAAAADGASQANDGSIEAAPAKKEGGQFEVNINVEGCGEDEIKEQLETLGLVDSHDNRFRVQHCKGALVNFCKLATQAAKLSEVPGVDDNSLDKIKGMDLIKLKTIEQPGAEDAASGEGASKKACRRVQAAQQDDWVGAPKNEDLATIKHLYGAVVVVNANLQGLTNILESATTVSWAEVRRQTSFIKAIGPYFKAAWERLKALGSNVAAVFTNIWSSFKNALHKSEQKCRDDDKARTKQGAKASGISVNDVDDKNADSMAASYAGKSTEEMEGESKKLESAINSVEGQAHAGNIDDKTMQQGIDKAKAASRALDEEVIAASDPDKAAEDSRKAEGEIKGLEDGICRRQSASAMSKLKEYFQKAKDVFVKATQYPVPTLGIRGTGFAGGPMACGLEEIIDFRNREIGQFRWGAAFYGPSATGAGLGGYAGIGWKGYKQNWTLEDGVATGLWMAYGLSPSFFGLSVGIGMTIATDADNSQGGPWIPEPHGINAVIFGWSVSASLASIAVPVSVDSGASLYWIINTECYDSLSEFVKYIWAPMCKGCSGTVETVKVTSIRTFINAVSFWPLNNIVFSLLATFYDKYVREKDYKAECSLSSTNNRGNITLFAQQTAKLLSESAQLLTGVGAQSAKLKAIMESAKDENPDFSLSYEYSEFKSQVGKFVGLCPNDEPSFFSDERIKFRQMTRGTLVRKCGNYRLESCNVGSNEDLANRVGTYANIQHNTFAFPERRYLLDLIKQAGGDWNKYEGLARECTIVSVGCAGPQWLPQLRQEEPKTLLKICDRLKIKCRKEAGGALTRLFKFKAPEPLDNEMIGLLLITAAGGGSIDRADKDNPFGMCSDDLDCHAPNQECVEVDKVSGISKCVCRKSSCYDLDPQGKPKCEAHTGDPEQVLDETMREISSYRIEMGTLMYHLKKAVSEED